MVQITVLKVDISYDKGRKKLMQAVSGVRGVDRVDVDVNKGTLTVTGNADPYEIILQSRKVGKFVEVVSVGPLPPPPGQPKPQNEPKKPDDNVKKPEDKKPDQKPSGQTLPQVQPKAQPQANAPPALPPTQSRALPQAQPPAQLQFHAQFPTQAHSHVQNPNSCPVCEHMYTYQWPVWQNPMPHYHYGP